MRAEAALIRQWRIIYMLSHTGGVATVRSLVEQSKASEKTIRRDLEVLRKVGFPLIEHKGSHGLKHWKLASAADVPPLKFTLEEAAALYLGRQFLEPLAGTYFFAGARAAFAKIRDHLGEALLRHLEKLAAAVYLTSHGLADYAGKGEQIDDLLRAIEDSLITCITYQSLRTTEPVTLVNVYPYALAYHRHALYLIAWSEHHREIRVFKVDRISSVETTRLPFQRPPDFDAATFLSGSFGIFASTGEAQTIRIRFATPVARILREKTFHPSQRPVEAPSGTLLATYELSSVEEFLSWILSFGPHAEVLEPESLRAQVVEKLEESLGRYREEKTKRQGRAVARRTPK